jgi:Flp pilus assembly protein TadD
MSKRTDAQAARLTAEATSLYRVGRRAEAEQGYLRALALVPDNIEALNNLAIVQAELGKNELAVDVLHRLRRLRPRDPLVNFSLGRTLLQLNRPDDALLALERAVELKAKSPDAQYCLGLARAKSGNHDGAIVAYATALRAKPDFTEALTNLCDEYMIQGDWQSALDAADATIRLFPDHANALYVKGGLLGLVGRLDEAERVTHEVLRLNPNHAGAYSNLGAISTWRQKLPQAVAEFTRALELQPDIQEARSGLAYALLAIGDFEQGWFHHEQSRSLGLLAQRKQGPVLWDGKPMPQGTLTLFGEAGLGDVLQFCRLVPLARERVARVVLYLQAYYQPLARLLATLEGVDEITLDPDCLRVSDASLSVFSLPYVFKASLQNSPVPVPYLRADPALSARWAERMRDDPLPRIGLVWGGNPRLAQARISVLDRRRSIPLPAMAPLLAVPAASFYCLQKGAAAQQLKDSPLASRIIDYTADISDFADTAALMDQLDLIVTVDTSVVHLAGALGKPVWLLNRFDSCWRWGNDRDDAAWYPSLRIFRQAVFGDWSPVIERVAHEVSAWTSLAHRRD